jgi:hypothetical protein
LRRSWYVCSGREHLRAGGAAAVSKSAVRREDGRDAAWIVQEGRLKRRAISLGLTNGDDIAVMAGLMPGERVVVEGPATLVDGQRVRTTNP